jgi:DNA repair exonuclease SbcCD ATPase subunit
MIPQRIYVRGLLCYRDPQEVSFDGASVWMLTGPNGSGKSALFDAMTYALFGQHRAGKQNAKDLINKNSDELEVEFDFWLDNRLYQARRTLRQTGKPTRQIRFWNPSGGVTGGGTWEEEPDTESEDRFDDWVRGHLGLTYETFTSSVLLLQGKAEKLLDAKPEERRGVLAGVVGLKRYEDFHHRVNERCKELKTAAEMFQAQLKGLPQVNMAELKKADARVKAARRAQKEAKGEVRRFQSLALALPLLCRLDQERENLRHARGKSQKAETRECAAAAKVQQLKDLHAPLARQSKKAKEAREQADHCVTENRTLLKAIRERGKLFLDIAGKRRCDFCGQELSPDHIKQEKARLKSIQEEAEEKYKRALQAQRAAAREEQRVDQDQDKVAARLKRVTEEVDKWQRLQQDAGRETQRSAKECAQAYRQLAEPFRSLVSPRLPKNWLTTSFPTKRDLADLRREHTSLKRKRLEGQLDDLEDVLHEAQGKQDELVDRHEQRQKLQRKYLKSDNQHQLYRLLAELLGPKRLQLFLLKHAERGIIAYANAVLDRLSAGKLFLRIRGEEGGEPVVGKALVLEAFDQAAAGQAPIDVRFLSGSQRFRVAVSLALGIGQYASQQHRPIESVIIDEGFGCLDRQGRQVMIQELQNLRSHLQRVLIVSHQEEFADAFADGYRFELCDGSTQVMPFER